MYCGAPKSTDVCRQCCKNMKHIEKIDEWRKNWGDFYDFADEITVFSESSRDIITQIYPNIAHKITVIPHIVPPMEQPVIEQHSGINIGLLGNCVDVAKGGKIIEEMVKINQQGVNFIAIGMEKNAISGLYCSGQYEIENLPEIIKSHKIDIIFIPSICPETFSYTTSEAISMNLPVACFNIGAPVERVWKYKLGLIISNIDAKTALNEIIEFTKNLKNQ
jgi:glycosyltransferase involved in cell wall biosynthesis